MTTLVFRVAAIPKPQGSKRAFITKPKEGSGKEPRAIVVDQIETVKVFRESVRTDAVDAQPPGFTPFDGPVCVILAFAMPQPQYVAKSKIRLWPTKKNTGDIDKLARATLDALTDAGVWGDDGQVVRLTVEKDYPGTPESRDQLTPGVWIHIEPHPAWLAQKLGLRLYDTTREIPSEEGTLL